MPKKGKFKFKKEKEVKKVKVEVLPKVLQTLRGFKDILPTEQKYWYYLKDKIQKISNEYNFLPIDTPLLEATNLFIRGVGKQTDIVEKEMFSFLLDDNENISLRPEPTAAVARAYLQHGMINQPQPVKLYLVGPMFRYDRPQSGRQRQFHQASFEVLGDGHPVIDAQLLIIAYNFFQEIGLEIDIQINSLGCLACRAEYKKNLINFFRLKRKFLCEDCKRRLVKNPLRILDCKEEKCQELQKEAPQIIDWLCEECKGHFIKVLEYLDESEIPYNLNSFLVRGLDYYTKTVFEFWPVKTNQKSQNALGGGGRYDNLTEVLGGRSVPAAGFGLGLERIILQLKERDIKVPEIEEPQIFLAQLGESARRKALTLFELLKQEKIKVVESFSKDSLKNQLDLANKLGVKFSLILGQKEVLDGTILIRDMEAGIQEIINYNKVVEEVKKKLGSS